MARGDPGEATYTPQVQPEDLPRKIIPRAEPGPVGPALEQFGNALNAKYQADSATWAGNQVAAFRLKSVQDLENMKASAPAGDPGNFTERYLAQFDKQATDLADTSGANPYARAMVEKGLGDLRNTLATHTLEWEAQQRVASQNASIQTNLDKQLPIVRAHPELADQVGSTLMDQINSTRNDPATKAKFGRLMDSQLTQSAALGLVDQNPGEVYRQMMSDSPTDPTLSRLTDPTSRAQVLEAAQAGVVKSVADNVLNTYRVGGPQAGSQAYAAVDQLQLSGTPVQQDGMREQIRDAIRQGRGQLAAEQQQKLAPQVLAVEEALRSGNPGPGTRASIWGLYHQNAIEPPVAGAYLGELDSIETKRAAGDVATQAALDAYRNSQPLDPKDTDVKSGVGDLFNGLTKGVAPGSAQYAIVATDIAKRTGVVPEPAVSWARANLDSGDANSAAQSADLIARFEESNPRALGFAVDEPTKAMADSISRAVRAGTPAQIAVDQARQNATLPKAQLDDLTERWKANNGAAQKGQPDALTKLLKSDPAFKPGFFYGVPVVPPALQGQFDELTRSYYNLTDGNLDQARELAARDIKRTWGVTAVNGDRQIMQYAPEAMFPGLSPLVVRADIEKALSDSPNALQRPNPTTGTMEPVHPSAADVRLIPTDRTARTGGLEWSLGAPDEFGALDVLRGANGNPVTYRLPVDRVDFDAVRERMNQATLAKARQLQPLRNIEREALLHEADDILQ